MFRIMRWMVVALLVVVVAAGAAVDYAARRLAEAAVASHVKADTHASSTRASIGGWPFLYDVFAAGVVPSVDVTATEVPVGASLTIQSVSVDLAQVAVDKHRLWSKHKVTLTGIRSGTAVIRLSAANLAGVLNRPVAVTSSGQLEVSVAGVQVPATVSVTPGDVLQISASGLGTVPVYLGANPIVPACDLSVSVTPDGLSASCTMSPVPPAVIAAISG